MVCVHINAHMCWYCCLAICLSGHIQGEKGDASPHVNGESLEVDSEEEDSDELEEEDERGTEHPSAFPAEDNQTAKEGAADASKVRKVIGIATGESVSFGPCKWTVKR